MVTAGQCQPSPSWVLMPFKPGALSACSCTLWGQAKEGRAEVSAVAGDTVAPSTGGWCLLGDAPSSSAQGGRRGVAWGAFHPQHLRDEGQGEQVTCVPVPTTPRRCLFVAQIGLEQASPIPVGHCPLCPCSLPSQCCSSASGAGIPGKKQSFEKKKPDRA